MKVEVAPDRQVRGDALFSEEIRLARSGGDHLWISVVCHRMSASALSSDEPLHLDVESLRTVQTGCYVCERPWDVREAKRRCPGEPKGGGPWRGRT